MSLDRNKRLAVFRTNGGPSVGAGHMTRCYALATALAENDWHCVFVGSEAALSCGPRIAAAGVEAVAETDTTHEALMRRWAEGCDLLVFDHYGLDAGHESMFRDWARRILVIDDIVGRAHDCDLLLDPTFGRYSDAYDDVTPQQSATFCGPNYAPLRPEFAAVRAGASDNFTRSRILVSLGSTDPANVTLKVLRALRHCDAEIDVVLGAEAPHLEQVGAAAEESMGRVKLHTGIDAGRFAKLILQAKLAVAAGGSGAWERCALGLPGVLVTIANNQHEVAAALSDRGAALSLGDADTVTEEKIAGTVQDLLAHPERLALMEKAARMVCDAQGARRLALMIGGRKTKGGAVVTLRPAARADRDLILSWQQDPSTRQYFHNPEPPTREQHEGWFAKQRHQADIGFFVVEVDGAAAGTLRLDPVKADDELPRYLVSILTGPDWRGLGAAALPHRTRQTLHPSRF